MVHSLQSWRLWGWLQPYHLRSKLWLHWECWSPKTWWWQRRWSIQRRWFTRRRRRRRFIRWFWSARLALMDLAPYFPPHLGSLDIILKCHKFHLTHPRYRLLLLLHRIDNWCHFRWLYCPRWQIPGFLQSHANWSVEALRRCPNTDESRSLDRGYSHRNSWPNGWRCWRRNSSSHRGCHRGNHLLSEIPIPASQH